MARLIAKERVKEEIRRSGGKVALYSARELIERADAYIAAHRAEITRELVMRRCERWLAPMRRVDIASDAQNRER
jgi:hypothetical protein